ncbi:MAG: DUF2169 domain-containing protein [Polyangiaceae bacterium]|nr:DUF2169 domain-containing protein [Polyangiaceae bacterium]
MIEIVAPPTLATGQMVWRPTHGGFVLTLVCKATFALRPGSSPLSPTPQAVVTADQYESDGALKAASDYVPLKRMPEVILTGHAYAPGGRRVPRWIARIRVGEVDKSIQLEGDRAFESSGALGEPTPTMRMPLTWQRAARGLGSENPVGRDLGPNARPNETGGIQAPNLLPPGFVFRSRAEEVPAVGFGPIAPHWPIRARCLKGQSAGWDPARWNERPLPDDLDFSYFNAAPPDQRRPQPFGDDEELVLENLHPLFGDLSTRLVPLHPLVNVDRGRGEERIQLRADTLWVDTNRGTATLVWRGHLVVAHPDETGRATITTAHTSEVLRAPVPARAPMFDHTQAVGPGMEKGPAMPFSRAAEVPPTLMSPTAENAGTAPRDALPMAPARDALPIENALLSGATLPVDQLMGSTLAFGFTNAKPAVPFSTAIPNPAAESPREAVDPSPWAPSLQPSAPERLPNLLSPMPLVVEIPPEPPPAEPVMLTWEQRLAVFSVERCGAITASIARRKNQTNSILKENNLEAADWAELKKHWESAIDNETSRGKRGLLAAFDAGYVAQLENERGPLGVEQYARLVVAAERGMLADVLSELGLPRAAMMRIERVWLLRMAESAELDEASRLAVMAERER